MPNIYQDIWSADMTGNDMVAIFDDEEGDAEKGYVKVNRQAFSPGAADEVLKVITEVKVPDAKMANYELVRRLFDNYALDEKLIEVETPQEREEVHDLVQAMIDTAPMQVARSYVQNAVRHDDLQGALVQHAHGHVVQAVRRGQSTGAFRVRACRRRRAEGLHHQRLSFLVQVLAR